MNKTLVMNIKKTITLSIFFLLLSLNSIKAQDWPNLKRFHEANQAIGLPKEGEKRVVFMGNSITEGWLKTNPELFSKSYINRGISGQTTPQMLIRFRPDVIELQPKVVVILAGTNDIAGNTGHSTLEMIMDNLISMSELAKANDIKVILCSVLPAFEYPWRAGKDPVRNIAALNQMIKKYAIKNNFTYLDYYSAMVDERLGLDSIYTHDGVHPTKEGYNVMQPMVEEAIKQVLNN